MLLTSLNTAQHINLVYIDHFIQLNQNIFRKLFVYMLISNCQRRGLILKTYRNVIQYLKGDYPKNSYPIV